MSITIETKIINYYGKITKLKIIFFNLILYYIVQNPYAFCITDSNNKIIYHYDWN